MFFQYRLRYIDVHRQTRTSLDVLQESSIDDWWNIDGESCYQMYTLVSDFDKRSNRLRQDQIILGQNTGPHYQKVLSVKQYRLGNMKCQYWNLQKNNTEEFITSHLMISGRMQDAICKAEVNQRCRAKRPP